MFRLLRGVCLSAAVAIALASCGGGGGSTPTTPSTPAPSTATLTSLTVTSPAATAKTGESAQFAATAVMSNGTTQTVTAQSTWQSSNTAVATVSASGMVAAVGVGEVDIRATYQTVSGLAHISVTASSFTLCGTVRESTTNAAIGGARVEILTGVNAGKATDTDNGGAYCINAVQPGSSTVRARKSDYTSVDQSVTVSANTTLNFALAPTSAPNPNPNPNPGPTPTPGPNGPTCTAASIPSNASCINNGTPPVTAVCNDGEYSCSQNRQGTCSTHSGVKCWVCPGTLCNGFGEVSEPYYSAVPLPWAGNKR